ncbi:MAG TPA: hypothetical protein VFB72_14015, partial [Verrucomicrobiae bacterium]|nr:hypothetical protein [Verrucomicrobiae bacterium]
MNNKFDQLAKGLAQSVSRRQAFKHLACGIAGVALACFGMSGSAKAAQTCLPSGSFCQKGAGPAGDQCGKCCSGSHFCMHSADIPE